MQINLIRYKQKHLGIYLENREIARLYHEIILFAKNQFPRMINFIWTFFTIKVTAYSIVYSLL